MNKRLLIIGASVLQLPAIKKAKQMGLYVGVADYNPQAIGIPFADEYFNVSTIDEQGIYEVARVFKADGIMTLATDMPMRALAYACQKLGLVGISYDTAIKSTDKGEMIQAFDKAGVAHPWYYIIQPDGDVEQIQGITFPCITKPTDNSGSRGVMLVHDISELKDAICYSSANGRKGGVIVEEYMEGPEVSVEVMVIDGTPHVLQITDKLTTGAPHFVEMGHSQPSQLPLAACEAIRELASKAVLSVGIQNGPAHVEIIVTKNGPKMVELGARMGGDCITTHLIPLSTGIDMVKATIELALNEKPDIEHKLNCGAAIRYMENGIGRLSNIAGIDRARNIPGIKEITTTKEIGDQVGEICSSVDRIGHVIAQDVNAQQAIAHCNEALKYIAVTVN